MVQSQISLNMLRHYYHSSLTQFCQKSTVWAIPNWKKSYRQAIKQSKSLDTSRFLQKLYLHVSRWSAECAWFHAKLHPTVLVSDNLDHSKETIIPYMDIILKMPPDSVQTVSIWSNNPSSQFINQFMGTAAPLLERKFKKGIV